MSQILALPKPAVLTNTHKVFIVNWDHNVYRMIEKRPNYVIETSAKKADVFVFTGGADISPVLYDEKCIPETRPGRIHRDKAELDVFLSSDVNQIGKVKVGICRGAQLLNVLSGGSLYQHVDGHMSHHLVLDLPSDEYINVSSVHHQMMRPGKKAELIAVGTTSNFRQTDKRIYQKHQDYDTWTDPEVVWYNHTECLCFQAHPEYGPQECHDYFWTLVDKYSK